MITIVSKDYCPYCSSAKQLITSLGFEYEEIDVTSDVDMLRKSVEASGMMTVPQIYAWELSKENFLGGFSEIDAMDTDWKLIPRLEKA